MTIPSQAAEAAELAAALVPLHDTPLGPLADGLTLRDIGLPVFEPKGAFYIFPDIRCTGMKSSEFCEKLVQEEKVAVVPGTAFGEFGEGYIRLSYATSMQCLEQGLQELEEFVRSHETKGDPA